MHWTRANIVFSHVGPYARFNCCWSLLATPRVITSLNQGHSRDSKYQTAAHIRQVEVDHADDMPRPVGVTALESGLVYASQVSGPHIGRLRRAGSDGEGGEALPGDCHHHAPAIVRIVRGITIPQYCARKGIGLHDAGAPYHTLWHATRDSVGPALSLSKGLP